MTDFTHPLDPAELAQRRQQAQEFADVRDQIAIERGLEPHQPHHAEPEDTEGGTTD